MDALKAEILSYEPGRAANKEALERAVKDLYFAEVRGVLDF